MVFEHSSISNSHSLTFSAERLPSIVSQYYFQKEKTYSFDISISSF